MAKKNYKQNVIRKTKKKKKKKKKRKRKRKSIAIYKKRKTTDKEKNSFVHNEKYQVRYDQSYAQMTGNVG